MLLQRAESGHGDRLAVLLHGFNCDSGDWWQVTPELIGRGYRVSALDLRGHGLSPRSERYRLLDFAEDVVESLAGQPIDVMIGHSLGASVAAHTIHALRPGRAIYLDPPWSPIDDETRDGLFPDLASITRMSDTELESVLRQQFPRWSDEAIAADIASWRRWDPASEAVIADLFADSVPLRAEVPSLVLVADPSVVMLPAQQEQARGRGLEVRVAPGLSHSLFRDDVRVFLHSLDGWI